VRRGTYKTTPCFTGGARTFALRVAGRRSPELPMPQVRPTCTEPAVFLIPQAARPAFVRVEIRTQKASGTRYGQELTNPVTGAAAPAPERGAIAMARLGWNPNSASAQFLYRAPNPWWSSMAAMRCSAVWSRAWRWWTRSPGDSWSRPPCGRAGELLERASPERASRRPAPLAGRADLQEGRVHA